MCDTVTYYRDLHRIPELSGQERKTADYIAGVLSALGYRPQRLGHCGVSADLVTDPALPWILLRADMDALPIEENSCAAKPSEHPGVMHACGHDSHVAMLLGAAKALAGQSLPRNIRFLFQPAEEITEGAGEVIAAGAIPADTRACFAVHVWPGVPKGQLVTRPGALMASSDRLELTVTGKSAHCGQQHLGADALRTAVDIAAMLPQLRAKAEDPRTVLFCGSFHSGTTHNVVADRAVLTGTVRTLHRGDRVRMKEGLAAAVQAAAERYGTHAELVWLCSNPALDNDAQLVARLEALGLTASSDVQASLTAEDFALYQAEVPGVLLWLGLGDTPPLHTPAFYVPEDILKVGVDFWCRVAAQPW